MKNDVDDSMLGDEKLMKEVKRMKVYMQELEETNKHLVTATFRERDLRKVLTQTLDELNKTKAIVEGQNKKIRESINYSRRIQSAINADEKDLLKTGIDDGFIFYKPKDVISGDYPWLFIKKNCFYVAAADCTGHGVPGAMMSMIGNLLLNDIMNNNKLLTPGSVLDNLHTSVVDTLNQKSPDNNSADGMDIALCRIDIKAKQLVFSGAHRPLYHINSDRELIEIKGDRFPIGGVQYDKKRTPFKNTEIKFNKGDSFFFFSDGLPDQIGGTHKNKFMIDRVEEILVENKSKSMQKIKQEIEHNFDEWKGDLKQIDDVIMIGIRI